MTARRRHLLAVALPRLGASRLQLWYGGWAGAVRMAVRVRQERKTEADLLAVEGQVLSVHTALQRLGWSQGVDRLRWLFGGLELELMLRVWAGWAGRLAMRVRCSKRAAAAAMQMQRHRLRASFGTLAGEARMAIRARQQEETAAVRREVRRVAEDAAHGLTEHKEAAAVAAAAAVQRTKQMVVENHLSMECRLVREHTRRIEMVLRKIAHRRQRQLVSGYFGAWMKVAAANRRECKLLVKAVRRMRGVVLKTVFAAWSSVGGIKSTASRLSPQC